MAEAQNICSNLTTALSDGHHLLQRPAAHWEKVAAFLNWTQAFPQVILSIKRWVFHFYIHHVRTFYCNVSWKHPTCKWTIAWGVALSQIDGSAHCHQGLRKLELVLMWNQRMYLPHWSGAQKQSKTSNFLSHVCVIGSSYPGVLALPSPSERGLKPCESGSLWGTHGQLDRRKAAYLTGSSQVSTKATVVTANRNDKNRNFGMITVASMKNDQQTLINRHGQPWWINHWPTLTMIRDNHWSNLGFDPLEDPTPKDSSYEIDVLDPCGTDYDRPGCTTTNVVLGYRNLRISNQWYLGHCFALELVATQVMSHRDSNQ